jgi:TRAP-type transport system small permease protein
MRAGLAAAVGALRRALDVAAAVLLVAVLAVTAARVAGRYVLGLPMPWSEELTRLLFVWLVMLAAARATHMRIEIVHQTLTPRLRRWLALGVAGVSVALLTLLVYYGLALVELTAFDRYTALGVSVEYLLPSDPYLDLLPNLSFSSWHQVGLQNRHRIVERLEKPRNGNDLVAPDALCALLKPNV